MEAAIGGFKGARALDIGAGGGGHAIALAEYGCETTALEIDETRLQWLRARVKDHGMQVRVATQKIESLPKAPYIKLRGVRRNAWVTAIPSLGAVRRQSLRTHPKTEIDTIAPVGIEKITNPETIKHCLARTVLCTLKRTRLIPQPLMKQLVIDQGVTREVLIFPSGKAQRVVAAC